MIQNLLSLITSLTFGAIVEKTVEYKDGGTVLEGFVAYDDAATGKRPLILIGHDWMGVGDYVKERSRQLARLGYVAFAADIYGKGVRPQNADEAGKQATQYKSGDRKLMRARAVAALNEAKKLPNVDKSKVAAMGYCFGGTVALELARTGADLKGVISFHGGLSTPNPSDAKKMKAKVLALHGADDPFVPAAEVAGFEYEMRNAKVDWQLIAYGGAVHSFTQKASGNDNKKGAAYNKSADQRSWIAMENFLKEIF